MPQRSSTLRTEDPKPRSQRLKKYDFHGRSTLTQWQPTDSEALKSLAEHFEIPRITLESFRSIGGERIMCGKRQVFPPLNADA